MKVPFKLFLFLVVFSASNLWAATPAQRLQQLVDYLGVDYGGAVQGGEVVDASEYQEMVDFAANLVALVKQLPERPQREAVQTAAIELRRLVHAKAPAQAVADQAARLRRLLLEGFDLAQVPRKRPDLNLAGKLYAENCAACHGAAGRGDGPLAKGMAPAPTDFTDLERYRQRTLQGLYATITHGVEGTAMAAWPQLSEHQRWSLAFLVGGMAPRAAGLVPPEAPQGETRVTPGDLTTRTPAELASRLGPESESQVAWLRTHPEALFPGAETGLALAGRLLGEALAAYEAGNADLAHEKAVSAYLEGFELVEGNLDAVDADLRHRIEAGMTALRGEIRAGEPFRTVQQRITALRSLLTQAGDALSEARLGPTAAFTSALMILLREGLEAILVVAALAAFLIRTGRRDGLRYLQYGILSALALGVLTWVVSGHLVTIGGADRELTEGVAALVAALMLFWIGFWLHGKSGAAQWQKFINGSVEKALSSGTLWGLAGLAFIAVYREVFETVLFYQALWLQTGETGRGMLVAGLAAAAALLVVLAVLILRYSTRLPLRQFFAVTGLFMFVLAVIFAGKGVAALQEAGWLPVSSLDLPGLSWVGLQTTIQGLAVQLALVVLGAGLLWWSGRRGLESPPARSAS